MVKNAPLALAELQALFQKAILNGDDGVLQLMPGNSRTTRDVLFGVYRHAYVARLVEILSNEHPSLPQYLGQDVFREIATAYIAAHPSVSPNARWVPKALPEFLAKFPKTSERPEIAEIAQLERALNDAFDAPDGTVLEIASLAAVPPEQWSELIFLVHASVRRLDFATNAYSIWGALSRNDTPPDVTRIEPPESLIVWRHELTSTVRTQSPEEAMLWDEAARGVAFGALCEMAAVYDDPDNAALRVAGYLQGWIAGGALASVTLQPKTSGLRPLANA